jgi:MFS family permease
MTLPSCVSPVVLEEVLTVISSDFDILNLTQAQLNSFSANIVSTLQAGCFFGSLFAAPLSDQYGRRITLTLAGLVFCIGSAMQTASGGNRNVMYIGRAIGGFVSRFTLACLARFITD